MKNTLKKLSGLVLGIIMVLAMSIMAFALDANTIEVTGIGEDATSVKAYQILKQDPATGAWELNLAEGVSADSVGISATDFYVTESDPEGTVKPSDETLGKINALINAGSFADTGSEMTPNADNTAYTKSDCEPGLYYVKVSGGENVYNPMVCGVQADGTTESLAANTANGKSQPMSETTTKDLVKDDDSTASGDDTQIGDTINFKVTQTIPEYNEETYKWVKVYLEDTLSKGLTLDTDSIVVKDSTGAALTKDKDYSVTTKTNADGSTKLLIAFSNTYIFGHANEKLTITYSALLNENATTNFDANTNKAKLNYSTSPYTGSDADKTPGGDKDIPDLSGDDEKDPDDPDDDPATEDTNEKTTYSYTFELDGDLYGSNDTINKKTNEFYKINADGSITKTTDTTTGDTVTATGALEGATFTLYTDAACTTPATRKDTGATITGTSDAAGRINIKGLDATTYYMKETSAPDGYSLNSTVYTVKITANYNGDGTLSDYKVVVTDPSSEPADHENSFTATYKADKTVESVTESTDPVTIKDSKLGELPTTGGVGTYLFTILGVVVMAVAAGLFFIRKRRNV